MSDVTTPRSLIGRCYRHNVVMTGSTTDDAKPRRVLVAEDEALIRLDLAEMLREEGYEVVGEAGDGQEAVELAESLKPDLVIMDVKMPRRDGIDAASEIASKRIAPIVVLTAFSQRDLVERARDAGAMAYLVKPFSITDLIPAIEVAVSRFSEIAALEQEVATLSDRLETRKLVERAKGLLQTKQGMTEPEAFKWIQRAAMDRRTTMKRVAEVVLETLDTPKTTRRRASNCGNPLILRFRPRSLMRSDQRTRAASFANITHHGHPLAMFYPKHRRPGRSGPDRRCR